ncbi:unnamed protein product [Phytomonas sp. Hart1]|nr:unnamed protein product [Phytomonas sp. Hart1]|eukprot:CCW68203.1 unnamed protein product [Phytomonas sp. isolate Hart1]
MFRFSGKCLMARTLGLLTSYGLPDGFQYFEHKVADKDIHANYENLETLKLTLTRQDEFIFSEKPVKCVTIAGSNGECGIYPGHAYKIIRLIPAPIHVELSNGTIQKFFASGGFAHVNNEGSCDINCTECIPFSELDLGAAEKALAEQNTLLSSSKDEKSKSIVEVRIGVIEAVIQALRSHQ